MKYIAKISFLLGMVVLLLTGCEKKESLPFYANGKAPVLKSSVTSIAPTPADSGNNVVTFTWSNPGFATNPATAKYIVQVDSTGRNFSKAVGIVVTGRLDTTLIGKQINTILLGYGFSFGVTYSMDVRVLASYGNNNDQQISNTLTLQMTPYKIPPKVAPPSSNALFLVGDASQGGWNNPVPVPSQQFSQIDSVTYGGVFKMVGGKQYLFLPKNGDWGHKYAVTDNSVPGLKSGGSFGYDLSSNFPGPDSSGWYTIIVDFQGGKFTVKPYTGKLPDSLYIVGDATAGGWNNPVPTPSQKFTRLNSSLFEISLTLSGGKQYLFLPKNGDWGHKYAVADNSVPGLWAGGPFGYDLSSNFPGPSANGTYTIDANFATGTFKVVKQ